MKFVALLLLPLAFLPVSLHAQDRDGLPPPVFIPSVNPALIAKSEAIAAITLPGGTMERMMGPLMQKMLEPMFDGMSKMPVRELLKAGGMDPVKVDSLKPATVNDIMAIVDPNYRKRIGIIFNTMMPAMGKFMGRFEPDMRAGMAEAFASRYSAAELDQIIAFLKTPTGAKFGSGFMELATDPHYLARMQKIMPEMMRAMPEIMQSSGAELAKLPKPRTYKDLTKAERDRLTALLGADAKNAN